MRDPLAVLATLLILLAPRSSLHAVDLQKPLRIESGLIEGSANGTRDVVTFKGIPYAAPPVGDLRWREPQPAAEWDGVRKADQFGASCPQPFSTGAPPYTEEFYPKALDQGLIADLPILTGITADDFGPPARMLKTTVATFGTDVQSMFGEKKEAFAGIKDAYLERCPVSTDAEARAMAKRAQQEYRKASIHAWAAWRSKTVKAPVYTYLFDHAIPWPEHPEFGAFHSSDLVYWFGNLSKLKRPWTDTDRRVADQVSNCWVNFVKTGNPNGDGLPEWKAFAASRPATMNLGAQPGMRDIADESRMRQYVQLLDR